MKIRVIFAIAVASVATMALASIMTTLNARGEGMASNAQNQSGRFAFNVTKVTHREHTGLGGSFTFDMSVTNHPGPRVSMRMAQEMGVTDNQASFAGPGVLVVPSNKGPQEFQGRVSVVVRSFRHPEEPGDPDFLFVRFAREGGPTFEFEGRVGHGDISVSKTVSY